MCKAFTKRNIKEILRDPLSYIFCIAFPLVMLIVMTLINSGIPAQAQMDVFDINNLAPGIVVFGFSFVMLFICLQISKDRSSAFLVRLYVSPLTPGSYIVSYAVPGLLICLAQYIIVFLAAYIIGLFTGFHFRLSALLTPVLFLAPSAVLFVGLGFLMASLLGEKAAPSCCSVFISAASILGGIFMDVDAMGGTWLKICSALPFYRAVSAGRYAVNGSISGAWSGFAVSAAYAAAVCILGVLTFRRKMQNDIK